MRIPPPPPPGGTLPLRRYYASPCQQTHTHGWVINGRVPVREVCRALAPHTHIARNFGSRNPAGSLFGGAGGGGGGSNLFPLHPPLRLLVIQQWLIPTQLWLWTVIAGAQAGAGPGARVSGSGDSDRWQEIIPVIGGTAVGLLDNLPSPRH